MKIVFYVEEGLIMDFEVFRNKLERELILLRFMDVEVKFYKVKE